MLLLSEIRVHAEFMSQNASQAHWCPVSAEFDDIKLDTFWDEIDIYYKWRERTYNSSRKESDVTQTALRIGMTINHPYILSNARKQIIKKYIKDMKKHFKRLSKE